MIQCTANGAIGPGGASVALLAATPRSGTANAIRHGRNLAEMYAKGRTGKCSGVITHSTVQVSPEICTVVEHSV